MTQLLQNCTLIIAAGGSGCRFGGNKLLASIGGMPVLAYSLLNLGKFFPVGNLILVAGKNSLEQYRQICQTYLPQNPVKIIAGGAERSNSVLNGLQAVAADMEFVAIHDAARPLANIDLITASVELLQQNKTLHGVSAASKVVDTIKKVQSNLIVPREDLWAMETPQTFRLSSLRQAYDALPPGITPTDDTAILAASGMNCAVLANRRCNRKITLPEDLVLVENMLKKMS